MSNLSKKRTKIGSTGMSRLSVAMIVTLLLVVAGMTGYFGHAAGVQNGKQQVQPVLDQTQQQLVEMQQRVDVMTKPLPGVDPLAPPEHDGKFYAKQLTDKVDKADSPQKKEDTFWESVCTTQRELVGVPMSVFYGDRADTFREFGRIAGQYYTVLILSKKVSYHTESALELVIHVQQKMSHADCS